MCLEVQVGYFLVLQLLVVYLLVLYIQVFEGLRVIENGCYLDGMFGCGGYVCGVFIQFGFEGCLLVMDKDLEVIVVVECDFVLDLCVFIFCGSFVQLLQWDVMVEGLDGVLFDLGVLLLQLDVVECGFSFGKDGLLDMCMDLDSGESVVQWINCVEECEIVDVLWIYGEEWQSWCIVCVIVVCCEKQLFICIVELVELIVLVMLCGKDKIYLVMCIFQVICIYINCELVDLEVGFDVVVEWFKFGGCLVVISFYLLEDCIVKQYMNCLVKVLLVNCCLFEVVVFVLMLDLIGGVIKVIDEELVVNLCVCSVVLCVVQKWEVDV